MHCMRVACSRPRDGCSFPDSDVYHILDAMSQVDKVR